MGDWMTHKYRCFRYLLVLGFCLIGSVLAQNRIPATSPGTPKTSAQLARIADEYWQHTLTHNFYERFRSGAPVNELPDLSEESAKADAAFAAHVLAELEKVKPDGLTHQDVLTLKILRWQTGLDKGFAKYYWLDIEITPQSSIIPVVQRVLEDQLFHNKADLDHYIRLLEQYPALLSRTRKMLEGQLQRGIVLPKDGIPGAKSFLSSYIQPADKSPFFVGPERLASVDPALVGPFQQKVGQIIQTRINPEFEALVAYIAGDYARKAPDQVGLWQYPMGEEFYRFLVRAYTTLDISPAEVHRIGLESVARNEAEMADLRRRIGFTGSREEFHQFLQTDPRFIAKTPQDVQERLMSYVRRIEPRVDDYFLHVPQAKYGIKRLHPSLEGALTFGFYAEPTAAQPLGIYFFNGSQLNERSMFKAGPLILHELIPGHHFQLNLTAEDRSLPELRRHTVLPAYSEGWADYSSQLGEEMEAYRDDYDRYALLAQNMHQSVRLVVDTGMHAMKWSRSKAMEYMRQHELESETQIKSESLRYSMGIPAQALAYRMGSGEILELREKAQKELGKKFDIREFHDWILGSGPMPLEVLAEHVAWCIEQAKKQPAQSKPPR